MKPLLEHNKNGLFHQNGGGWAQSSQPSGLFLSAADADPFPATESTLAPPPVPRIDPALLARLSCRVPGVYQAGE